ncbi:PREDICTED: uncharacterized protein LOC105558702 isoform X2 [Vollenhovia emeryi]|uniref:uncharacterized protein LOC105558702 isoform X2 n=1 Tax=Vollenhovia emeryi TaxID=411798 RepID=UPI0005F3D5FC|nr:PREDICTED: uncharacterized protein LOC105558702 isoform X2 [Vollenhovia emeryi]
MNVVSNYFPQILVYIIFNDNLAIKCWLILYRDHISFFSENIMSYYVSNWKNSIDTKRVNVEEDHVDFIHQSHMRKNGLQDEELLLLESPEIYSDIKRREISCNYNINGLPTIFIDYKIGKRVLVEDSFSISKSSYLQETDYINSSGRPYLENIRHNCVDFEFQEAVYPIRVSIQQELNSWIPEITMEIWARDSDRWFLLWIGGMQVLRSTPRLLSPALRACDFKTKMLRLIFPYDAKGIQIDAVELIGTSELIQPKDPKQTLTDLLKDINCSYPDRKDMHNLTPDYKNANLDVYQLMEKFSDYCIIRKKSNLHLNNGKLKGITPSSSEFKKQPRCDFSMLPEEMILKILEYLDLRSLCLMSQTNKRFNRLTRDPSLFKYLNIEYLRMYKKSTDDTIGGLQCKILSSLESRCEHLQQLKLVFCDITSPRFVMFLRTCGSKLTFLRLASCKIDNDILYEIGKTCKNLTVLNLRNYEYNMGDALDEGLLYLQHLKFLEELTLEHILIRDVETLCTILHGKHRLHYLHLNEYFGLLNINEVLIQLQNKALFSNLETIKLSGRAIDLRGIGALAEFKNLRILSIKTRYARFSFTYYYIFYRNLCVYSCKYHEI